MYLFVITTVLSLATFMASDLIKPFFRWVYKATSKERELLRLKADLKIQQSQLSMVDQFAKYSRLQRRINVVDQELVELQNQRLRSNIIVRMLCTYGVRILIGTLLVGISIYYRSTPIMKLNSKFDLYPFSYLISYPTGVPNSVSVPFWIMCCTTVGRFIKTTE